MVMPGEVPKYPYDIIKCEDCGIEMHLMVCMSGGGYYLGHMCQCGPHSRCTGYYKTFDEAEAAMIKRDATWRQ